MTAINSASSIYFVDGGFLTVAFTPTASLRTFSIKGQEPSLTDALSVVVSKKILDSIDEDFLCGQVKKALLASPLAQSLLQFVKSSDSCLQVGFILEVSIFAEIVELQRLIDLSMQHVSEHVKGHCSIDDDGIVRIVG